MLHNVVFDMGNVLMRFDPDRILDAYTRDAGQRAAIREALFDSDEWQQGDAGVLSSEAHAELARARLSGATGDLAAEVMRTWWRHMTPVAGAEAFVRRVRAAGCATYVLTNTNDQFFCYCDSFPMFTMMDGIVVSAVEKAVKPHAAIYRVLFERYALAPETCFFIDDRPDNIAGGRALGMDGTVFTGDWDAAAKALAEFAARNDRRGDALC